jgi:hypothetical protein
MKIVLVVVLVLEEPPRTTTGTRTRMMRVGHAASVAENLGLLRALVNEEVN